MPANPMTYNPAQVMMGYSPTKPYLGFGGGPEAPVNMVGGEAQKRIDPQDQSMGTTLGSQAVRASGSGPFDAAYRQNLATYAGGLQGRPGGSLSFNPTGPASDFPTGPSLLEQALGGGAFSAPQPSPAQQQAQPLGWQDWLKRFREQGQLFGGGFRAQELQ